MSRNRWIRAVAGLVAAVVAALGLVAALADERMVGGAVAAGFFVVAALSGLAVAVSALVPSMAVAAQPIAAGAGVLLAFTAIGLVPFTAARSACACTQLPPELVPPPPSIAGLAAPHDVLFVAAIGAPMLLLLAANVGRGPRRPVVPPAWAREEDAGAIDAGAMAAADDGPAA